VTNTIALVYLKLIAYIITGKQTKFRGKRAIKVLKNQKLTKSSALFSMFFNLVEALPLDPPLGVTELYNISPLIKLYF
jgi:hypothetical protein